jgi:hypothetical protein
VEEAISNEEAAIADLKRAQTSEPELQIGAAKVEIGDSIKQLTTVDSTLHPPLDFPGQGSHQGDRSLKELITNAIDDDKTAVTGLGDTKLTESRRIEAVIQVLEAALREKQSALKNLANRPTLPPDSTASTASTPSTQSTPTASTPGSSTGFVIIAHHELGWHLSTTPDICQGGTLTLSLMLEGIPANTKVELTLTGSGLPPSLTLTLDPGFEVTKPFTVPASKGPTTWVSQITSIGGKPPPTSGAHVAAFAQCPTT